ncbi:hypothetical protein MASR2M50_23670 [Thauera sp.]|jgi:hypothetical protein
MNAVFGGLSAFGMPWRIARVLVIVLCAGFSSLTAQASTLTLTAVGKGSAADIEWVRMQLEAAVGTGVSIDPDTSSVHIDAGGNSLATWLRQVIDSPEDVNLAVDRETSWVFGQWYQENQKNPFFQGIDVADLEFLPDGDGTTIGPTVASVLFHEISQMYYALESTPELEYEDAHAYGVAIENLVYETLGNRGRRDTNDIFSAVYEDLNNPGTYKSFTSFKALDGVDWMIEGTILNRGIQIDTAWEKDWLGFSGITVPYNDLQWGSYIAYRVNEPGSFTLAVLALTGLILFHSSGSKSLRGRAFHLLIGRRPVSPR